MIVLVLQLKKLAAKTLLCFVLALSGARYAHGQNTRQYYIRQYNSENGLPQNSIKGLELDSKGYLWLITESGLMRFDGQNFHAYDQLPDGTRLRERAATLYKLPNDTMVVHIVDNRYFRPAGYDSLVPYTAPVNRNSEAWQVPQFTQDLIFKACHQQVERKLQSAWIIPDMRNNLVRSSKSYTRVTHTYYWLNGHRQLIKADTSLTQFQRIPVKGLPPLPDTNAITRILWDNQKTYLQWGPWIAVLRFSTDKAEASVAHLLHTGDIGLASAVEETMYDNIFFVGTVTNGLYQFCEKEFTTKTYPATYDNVFYAQAPFGDSDVVTERGIMTTRQAPALANFRSHTILPLKAGGYILNKWVAKPYNGLAFYDHQFQPTGFLADSTLATTCMFQDSEDRIWIGATDRFLGELKKDRIEWSASPDSGWTNNIVAMQEITPGEFWLASNDRLTRYNIRTHQAHPVKELNKKYIRTLLLDAAGILWIGTYGNGFYALADGRLTRFPLDVNGFLESVHAFLEDEKGYFWMSTNKGLFQARKSDLKAYIKGSSKAIYYHYYDINNGFLTNEFNGGCWPSAIRTANGLFSFPTMNGLVQFNPHNIEPVLSTGSLFIEKVKADSMIVPVHPGQLTVAPGIHDLQFSISSPFFGNRFNNHIEYKLEGNNSNWYSLLPSGIITFERLPPGHYTLHLRKWVGFGNQQVLRSQSFTILPPFYATIWFRYLAATLSLLLMWLIIWYRFRYLTRQQKRLEAEVVFRTSEQQKLIVQLESTVRNLELSKSELARHSRLLELLSVTITHDLQSPLRFFSDVSATLHNKAVASNDQQVAELSGELLNASRSIHRFVQEFGYWIKSMGKGLALKQEKVILDSLFEELATFTAEVLKQKGNTLAFKLPPKQAIQTDRQLLRIILRNLIDNANKHTRNGQITLSANILYNYMTITVSDTGRGFNEVALKRVREITRYSYNPLGEIKGHNGYGYYFIGAFCKLLNVNITINNRPGQGAVITMGNFKTLTS